MRPRKIPALIVALALIVTTLSGCYRIVADELYSLPQPSREYLKLQEQINAVLATGAEYSQPLSGPNRQSVQLKDLYGDGRNEGVAFFKMKTGDKPLKLYIFKQVGTSYETSVVIDGVGTAFDNIRYADLDGDGVSELIVGWRMSPTLLHMTIYSIKGGQHVLLDGGDYTEISVYDMNNDGNTDVLTVRLPSAEIPGQADMFSLRSGGEVEKKTVPLSKGFESFSKLLRGKLSDSIPALFIEGNIGSSVVTDILTWRDGSLYNITSEASSGVSEDTLRSYQVYSRDINSDGITEVPIPRTLPSPQADTTYYVIDWYAYNRYGTGSRIFTTYHDFQDEWYLILPEDWRNQITVSRQDSVGERTLIFSFLTGTEAGPVDFLKIYTLSGDNRNDRARLPNRAFLGEHGDIVYAAEILTDATSITVSKPEIISNFRLLTPDWSTGIY